MTTFGIYRENNLQGNQINICIEISVYNINNSCKCTVKSLLSKYVENKKLCCNIRIYEFEKEVLLGLNSQNKCWESPSGNILVSHL